MVTKNPKSCKHCNYICGKETSKEWQGYVIIVDHQKSEIAKKMNINVNGKFALRVR
jgi:DNA-directed RNA polymerase subunit E"